MNKLTSDISQRLWHSSDCWAASRKCRLLQFASPLHFIRFATNVFSH